MNTSNINFASAYREAVQNTMVMVSFHARSWNGQITDRKAMHDLAKAKEASTGAGKVTKNLLAGADSHLKACQAVINQARGRFYQWTLPMAFGISEGDNRGARALPNTGLIDFLGTLNEDKVELAKRVEAFVEAYPQCVENSRKALGQMFDGNDYPSPEEVRGKFSFKIEFMPMPNKAGYGKLHPDIAEHLGQTLDQRLADCAKTAYQEAWERAKDTAEHLVDRLSNPDAKFHDSLIENTQLLSNLLKHFNIMNDPSMLEVQQRLEGIGRHAPKQIRDDANLRQSLATESNEILQKVRVAMGLV